MKYLNRYNEFFKSYINKSVNDIDNRLSVIESKILNDFEKDFWHLSMKSKVFNNEEKYFISENLMTSKVDLINEGWLSDTLGNVWDKAKEKGGKILDKIKSKITIIKDNIKNLVKGISDFVKSLLSSISSNVNNKITELKNKTKDKFADTFKNLLNKNQHTDEEVKSELKQLTDSYKFIADKMKSDLFGSNIDSNLNKVEMDAESQVGEIETEMKNESADILMSFYYENFNAGDLVEYKSKDGSTQKKNIERIDGDKIYFIDKEGNEFYKLTSDIITDEEHKESKGVWAGFSKWVLDMEQSTPPVEGKAVWWIKLILKIITTILSPVVKGLEVAAKAITSNLMKGVSTAIKWMGGPGVYDFLILSAVLVGIGALATELSLVTHGMKEEWAHIFEIVSHFLSEMAGIKVLTTVFGSVCTFMTFYQLIEESKHLIFGGHEH